jgi:hypothetical protein
MSLVRTYQFPELDPALPGVGEVFILQLQHQRHPGPLPVLPLQIIKLKGKSHRVFYINCK